MEDKKRSSKRKFGFIHKVWPTKKSITVNSLFFNNDCNVYSAEPYDVPFKFNNQIKQSPGDSGVRQSAKCLIDDIYLK